ncbi:hypothetical protein [Pinibacter aurantiacus]|uniref:Uncharacterized protein n=1 Tax=Pinibacter aurantiacus TaxID=2851599 RepID=A0A9E2W725_9BACT|nr:hypothetical protein [Pinibacter aurantiacus]MBV4355951.1 hypothetical protein [Pinibacter aurantiacus]
MDTKEKEDSLWASLKASILPIQENDHPAVKAGKHIGFWSTIILLGGATVAIGIAILLAL